MDDQYLLLLWRKNKQDKSQASRKLRILSTIKAFKGSCDCHYHYIYLQLTNIYYFCLLIKRVYIQHRETEFKYIIIEVIEIVCVNIINNYFN